MLFYKQLNWWLWDNQQKKFCILNYFATPPKENAAKKLVFWHFLLWLECAKIKGEAQKYFFSFYFTSITAHSSCLSELVPRWPFCFFFASSSYYLPFADQEVGRREKGDKNIWYVSSTTNCCYKENIDIIYQLHGGYRKDKTLTSLLQSSNSFVFITSLSPDHLAWMLVCSRLKKTAGHVLTNYAQFWIQKCNTKRRWLHFFMIFRSCLLLCENHVINFKLILFSNFQTSLHRNISPLLF